MHEPVHEHGVQLRWSDPDVYGHVNHARALALTEDARLTMAPLPAGAAEGAQPDLILARLEVDYLRQLRYRSGERLTVRSWVTRLGSSSVTVRQELLQDGATALRSDAVCVHIDAGARRPRPMTDDERAHWGRWLHEAGGDDRRGG